MSWEKDATRSSEVVVVAKNGMGYGEGAISTADQLKTGELTEQALAVAMEIVQERSEVFCDVDADANDDGCGDGRPAAKVFRYLKRHGKTIVEEYKKSRRRAKLFGGGLPVASSMWRVLQGLPPPAESVLQDRIAMADDLTSLGIAFAHTMTTMRRAMPVVVVRLIIILKLRQTQQSIAKKSPKHCAYSTVILLMKTNLQLRKYLTFMKRCSQ